MVLFSRTKEYGAIGCLLEDLGFAAASLRCDVVHATVVDVCIIFCGSYWAVEQTKP